MCYATVKLVKNGDPSFIYGARGASVLQLKYTVEHENDAEYDVYFNTVWGSMLRSLYTEALYSERGKTGFI